VELYDGEVLEAREVSAQPGKEPLPSAAHPADGLFGSHVEAGPGGKGDDPLGVAGDGLGLGLGLAKRAASFAVPAMAESRNGDQGAGLIVVEKDDTLPTHIDGQGSGALI